MLIAAALLIGAAIAVFGILILSDLATLKKLCTVETKGVVSELRKETRALSHGESTTYCPTFTYEYDGKEYTYSSRIGSSSPEFSEGEELVIMVDPNKPDRIYVPKESSGWGLGIALTVIGCCLFAVGAVGLIFILRARRRRLQEPENADQ